MQSKIVIYHYLYHIPINIVIALHEKHYNLWAAILEFDPREALQLLELRDSRGFFSGKKNVVFWDTIHRPVMLVKNHSDGNVDFSRYDSHACNTGEHMERIIKMVLMSCI